MASTPSKTIEEFLQRHPEVQTGAKAKAELEAIHDIGDTYCVVNKLFDNTILHQDYDGDSNKRVIAFAAVDDPEALAHYEETTGPDYTFCDCKVKEEEGAEHMLCDHMKATVPVLDVIFVNINANSDFRLLRTGTNKHVHHVNQVTKHIARGLYTLISLNVSE
ncbi:hypothetical protein F53441_4138 [Fusarium austroafricanum]|uniref:Uncharacterized protein n=1 Tax=Fusarium austroafricanum TaxID=2364996 RepID=A0A8H4KMM8_9HYPO|nr:hypothetical protein F53441_4138 [Fusarium austroafricanum]